jgi:hypothetical protein
MTSHQIKFGKMYKHLETNCCGCGKLIKDGEEVVRILAGEYWGCSSRPRYDKYHLHCFLKSFYRQFKEYIILRKKIKDILLIEEL